MSNRKKVTRLWSFAAAAVLLAVSTLVAPATTETAQAQTACAHDFNAIPIWGVLYDDRGVTMCVGTGGAGDERAYIQIVDLSAGAELAVKSDVVSDLPPPWSSFAVYHKRGVDSWFTWINNNSIDPPSSRLFSTTNASFFTSTTGSTTAFSLPNEGWELNLNTGITSRTMSYGMALADHTDPAWDVVKRGLVIGNSNTTPQDVQIRNFPTHYSQLAIWNHFDVCCSINEGATVALDPSEGSGGSFRTFAGIDSSHTKFYILTTTQPYGVGDAQDIIQSFGSNVEIQLDGGGSTQVYAEDEGTVVAHYSVLGRPVPDVLAVYLAPE